MPNLLGLCPIPVSQHGELSYGNHLALALVVEERRDLGLDGLVELLVVLLHHRPLRDEKQRSAT